MAFSDLPEIDPKPSEDRRTDSRVRDYYEGINHWCDSALEEGLAGQENVPEIREIQTALDYMIGMQWKEAMPSYRAKPVSNEFTQMFWEAVGLLTDLRPVFDIADIGAGGRFSKQERILNMMGKGWVSTSKFEKQLAFGIMNGMLTSGPSMLWWNPMARGTSGDPEDGDISMEALSATSILRLGSNGHSIYEDECVIYRKAKTLDWIKRGYPTMGPIVRAEGAKSRYTVDAQSPLGVTPQLFPPMNPGMKRLLGLNEKASYESIYPSADVQQFWRNNDAINEGREEVVVGPKDSNYWYTVKPGKKLYPRGQVIIRANRVILWDEPNPYYHRRKPFAMLDLLGVPWQQYAMSVVGPWMKQQDILNQIMSGVLQTVKKAISPTLMATKAAINPAAMKAIDSGKPNLKITYSSMASAPPSWQPPPQLAPYVLQVYGMVQTSMKQSSGASAAGDALGKKQVPAGDSIDKITAAKNTPIRLMSRNIESFLDDTGFLWVADALQFYDAARRIELLGPKEGLTEEDLDSKPTSLIPEGINSEAYVRRFRWKTRKGTMLGTQKQERTQIAFALRKGRDLSRAKLFQELDWNINTAENDAELQEEAKQMAQAQAAAGGGKKK